MELTNQAVRAVGAAAGFAAQTGMHAADTAERATKTAESALDAEASLREVVERQSDVTKKASRTATDAKNAADAATAAGKARDQTIAKLERTAARIVYMTDKAGVPNVSTTWLALKKFDNGVDITPRAGWRGYVVLDRRYEYLRNGYLEDVFNFKDVLWVESGKFWETNGHAANGAPAKTSNSGRSSWPCRGQKFAGKELTWSVLGTVYPYE